MWLVPALVVTTMLCSKGFGGEVGTWKEGDKELLIRRNLRFVEKGLELWMVDRILEGCPHWRPTPDDDEDRGRDNSDIEDDLEASCGFNNENENVREKEEANTVRQRAMEAITRQQLSISRASSSDLGIQNVRNATGQDPYGAPSFMRVLDLEAMHGPEFPQYANQGAFRCENFFFNSCEECLILAMFVQRLWAKMANSVWVWSSDPGS
ncbi:hypothetical protein PIB30_025207 [Stylosanthes scabra]|uniref:Uncharacterized protein n=1 Tax=Stylosanthes scabra TaxID=79078 RepID=A0ABU6Q9N2_9FABA|nr:hypothetical protein [Stylosanthes scabra]